MPNPFPISVDKITSFLVACVFFPAGVIKGLSPGCNVYSLSELYLLYLRLHHTLIWNHTQGKFTLDIVLCFLKACSDSICRPLHFPFLRQIALCFLSPSSIPQSLTCFLPLSPLSSKELTILNRLIFMQLSCCSAVPLCGIAYSIRSQIHSEPNAVVLLRSDCTSDVKKI